MVGGWQDLRTMKKQRVDSFPDFSDLQWNLGADSNSPNPAVSLTLRGAVR